jgi:hypothetical protein
MIALMMDWHFSSAIPGGTAELTPEDWPPDHRFLIIASNHRLLIIGWSSAPAYCS